jgi:N-acetylneuraminic acid mutarotase
VTSAAIRVPAPIQRVVAVASGSTVYLAGGLDASGASVDTVDSLDVATRKVDRLGRLPQAVHDAAGAMIGGMLYVFAGGTGSGTDTVQTFDPTTGAGTIVGHLPVALSDLASVTIGPVTYLVGGYDGIRPRSEIYATRDGTNFRVVGRLPEGLRYPAVTVLNGQILIAGGTAATGPTAAVRVFDPMTGRVRSIGRLLAPVAHAAAFASGGVVYVVGGRDPADAPVARIEELDLTTGRSRLVRPLPGPVADAGVARIGDGALLIGGEGATTLDQVLHLVYR